MKLIERVSDLSESFMLLKKWIMKQK
jgi:hypothetical protein